MSNLWTKKEESFLTQMVNAGKDLKTIYESFELLRSLSGFENVRTERAISDKIKKMDLGNVSKTLVEENLFKLESITSKYKEESIELFPITNSKDRFILSLSDIHLPFTEPKTIKNILDLYAKELANNNSIIVLNGDILDEYSVSVFAKYKTIHLLAEYNAAIELIRMCLNYTDRVALTKGNHEVRLNRMASEKLPSEVMSLYNFDLLGRIANGEIINEYGEVVDIDKNLKSKVRYQYKESWYCRIGKTIFAHPSGFGSGAPGSTVKKTNDLFNQRYTRDDYDSLMIGHTHNQSKQIVDGRLLIEQGALCGLLGYEGKANLKFGFTTNGYGIVYQDSNGNTNFNDSGFIHLGKHFPKKKAITWNKF